MNEDFKEGYETALAAYTDALKALSDLMNEPSGLDETKMRIIVDEEPKNFESLTQARQSWMEARQKYFGF